MIGNTPDYYCPSCERRWLLTEPCVHIDITPSALAMLRARLGKEPLTEAERDIMNHALKGGTARRYRNHYCASEGHESWPALQRLVERGLMRVSRLPSDLSGGDTVSAQGSGPSRRPHLPPPGKLDGGFLVGDLLRAVPLGGARLGR